jgi:hypothetical protein
MLGLGGEHVVELPCTIKRLANLSTYPYAKAGISNGCERLPLFHDRTYFRPSPAPALSSIYNRDVFSP